LLGYRFCCAFLMPSRLGFFFCLFRPIALGALKAIIGFAHDTSPMSRLIVSGPVSCAPWCLATTSPSAGSCYAKPSIAQLTTKVINALEADLRRVTFGPAVVMHERLGFAGAF
jgi:hypothetical protein